MKNKVVTVLLMLLLCVPVYAEPISSAQTETISYKQPISRRKIAKKFLLAMAGVGVSSVLLFLILSLYNKVREGVADKSIFAREGESLETPDNMADAIKTFLEKTRWDG